MNLLELKGTELKKALLEKENFNSIKKDKSILEHALSELDEDAVEVFLTHKFMPSELIKQFPIIVSDVCIKLSFNPGLDGLVEIAKLSFTKKQDRLLIKLINHFPTNKYDAGFLRTLLNLKKAKDIELSETISHLLKENELALVFLKELSETHTEEFFEVVLSLDPALKEKAIELINRDMIYELGTDKADENFLKLFNLIAEYKSQLFEPNYSASPFFKLFFDSRLEKQISDENAVLFLSAQFRNSRSYNSYHFGGTDKKFPYREAYEHLPQSLSYYLTEIPKSSKFYLYAFEVGALDVSAAEAISYLSSSVSAKAISPILQSGTDEEMAKLLEENINVFLLFLESRKVTPAVLRDALGSKRSKTAQVLLKHLRSDYRKQILSRYQEISTKSQKLGVTEKHQRLCSHIELGRGKDFKNELLAYEEGIKSEVEGFKAFLIRHSQSSYQKKYENLYVTQKFLKNLKDEEFALIIATSKLKISLYSHFDEKEKGFLSSKNALFLLRERDLSVSHVLRLCYEKEEFLEGLTLAELTSLDLYDEKEADLLFCADLLIKKARLKGTREKVDSFILIKEASKKLTKKEARELFKIEPFSDYDPYHELVFKDGERFTGEELLKLSDKMSYYRINDFLEALNEVGAIEELKRVSKAVLDKDKRPFNELFPKIDKRSSDLKALATRFLAKLESDSGEKSLDLDALIKKENYFSSLSKFLGENDYQEILINHNPKKRYLLHIDTQKGVKQRTLKALKEKYDLKVVSPTVETKEHLKQLKLYLENEIELTQVDLSRCEMSLITNNKEEFSFILNELLRKNIPLEAGDNFFTLALLPGGENFLRAKSLEEIIKNIDSLETLKQALSLDVPISESLSLAETICENEEMLAHVISRNVHFSQTKVPVIEYRYDKIKAYRESAKKIGIIILTEQEHRFLNIMEHVFDEKGNIKDFEPISLNDLSLKDRLDLIELLAEKNNKYKKLLSQDLNQDEFILNPPNLLEKSLITLSNAKDILGVGLPQNITAQEKDTLANLFTVHGSLLHISAKALKNLLSMAHLSGPIEFSDFFMKTEKGYALSSLALFLSKSDKGLYSSNHELFNTLFKDSNKKEVLSLIEDNGHYSIEFLKDAIHAFDSLREALNRFIAVTGEEGISASLVFSAMSGSSSANGILAERLERNDDVSESLRELSNLIKTITVELSIARKRLKAGENVLDENGLNTSMARYLHDRLGYLYQMIETLTKTRKEKNTGKLKTGFEKFNEILEKEEFLVNSKYVIYFPENNAEIREIGSKNGWCTSYNSTYFDSTISGKAVLFNLKYKGQIEAQGYLLKGSNGKFKVSQIKYKNNKDAYSDFNEEELSERILHLIQMDEKLKDRYRV